MAKQNDDTKPTLAQLQWLLERMNASRDPITRQQVETFGRHPGGPILPNECIAVECLPDNFGTRRKGRVQLDHDGPVHDLAVSPQGELWIATVINGTSMLVSRGTPEGEYPYVQKREHPLQGLTHIGLLSDEEMGTMFSPRIVGFRPDGTPITLLKKVASCSDSEYWGDDAFIFIGGKRAFEGRLPKQYLTAIRVTPDGTVLTAHTNDKGKQEIYRDGELLLRMSGIAIRDLWQCADDVVWIDERDEGLTAYNFRKQDPSYLLRRLVYDREVRDVFVRDGASHYVTTGSDGRSARLQRMELGEHKATITRIVWSSDGHAYLRGYEELPDGRIAYIGETVRDERECWVVDDVAAPGFERVTGLVFREGRARYYGSLGQHLYTMELPGITPKE